MVAIYDPPAPTGTDPDERIFIVRGDDWTQSFNAKDDAGNPLDLSSWSDWSAQWRTGPDDDPAYTLDVVSGGVTGVLTVSAPPSITRSIGNDGGWFDIQAATPTLRTFIIVRTHNIKDVTHA